MHDQHQERLLRGNMDKQRAQQWPRGQIERMLYKLSRKVESFLFRLRRVPRAKLDNLHADGGMPENPLGWFTVMQHELGAERLVSRHQLIERCLKRSARQRPGEPHRDAHIVRRETRSPL